MEEPLSRPETLSAEVFGHLSRLGLLGGVSQHDFLSLGWEAKVHEVNGWICCVLSATDGVHEQEALFVTLLDQLGRPTLGQYSRERRSFQNRPAQARLDRKKWSEETFRGIFLKIVLKDLKDVGFSRVLSVDDLLTKRRRSVLVYSPGWQVSGPFGLTIFSPPAKLCSMHS